MAHPRRLRTRVHHGGCKWTWRWRLAATPRMRRRSGEKLSIFLRDLPLPSETREDGLGPIPEVSIREVPPTWAGGATHLGGR